MNREKFKQSGILLFVSIIFTVIANIIWFVTPYTNKHPYTNIMHGITSLISIASVILLGTGIIKQSKKIIGVSYIVSIVMSVVSLVGSTLDLISNTVINATTVLDYVSSLLSIATGIMTSVAMLLFVSSVFTWKEKQGKPKFKQSGNLILISVIFLIISTIINAVKTVLSAPGVDIANIIIMILTANAGIVISIIPTIMLGAGILKQKKNVICASYIVSLVIDVIGTVLMAFSAIISAISDNFPIMLKYSLITNGVTIIGSIFTSIAMVLFVKSVFSWIEPMVIVPPQPQYVPQPQYAPQPQYVSQPQYVPQPQYAPQPQYVPQPQQPSYPSQPQQPQNPASNPNNTPNQ